MDRDAIETFLADLARQHAAMARSIIALEAAFNAPSKGLQTPVEPECFAAEYRRAHRPGRPSRIDTDPKLRAFILERIDRLTFEQLEAEVAANFPAARRVKRSTINDWWHRNGKPSSIPIPESPE